MSGTKDYKINKKTDHMFRVGGSFGRGEMCVELHAEIGFRGKRSYGGVVSLPSGVHDSVSDVVCTDDDGVAPDGTNAA